MAGGAARAAGGAAETAGIERINRRDFGTESVPRFHFFTPVQGPELMPELQGGGSRCVHACDRGAARAHSMHYARIGRACIAEAAAAENA